VYGHGYIERGKQEGSGFSGGQCIISVDQEVQKQNMPIDAFSLL
jgi:hypothetical protein